MLQEWATQVNLKSSTISLDSMYNIQSNSSANLEAVAVYATHIVRQLANPCTSTLWTASLSTRRLPVMQTSQQNVGISTNSYMHLAGSLREVCFASLSSTMNKLLWDGHEKESLLYYLLSTFWDCGWEKDVGYALSEGKCRNKRDFKTPGLLQQQKRKRSYGRKHCNETYGMFAGS